MKRRALAAFVGLTGVVSIAALPWAPGSARATEPRRVALIIGIADYEHFVPGGPPGRSDLRGPRVDVARMRVSLTNYGFGDTADTRVLLDGQATRDGIARGFAWLASRIRDTNDVAVIYFSGHGSQVADRNGDEARVAPGDSTDEALVVYDTRDPENPAEVIVDDQLGAWLDGLRTKRVNVIIDACFSGTVTRDLEDATPRGPTGLHPSAVAAASDTVINSAIDSPYPVLTAASANQTALERKWPELGGRYAGVLTYNLTRLLDAAVGTPASYLDLLPTLRRDMREWSAQTPTLDGSRDARQQRVLFASPDAPRRPFVLATRAAAGFVLNAGAANGMRRGAVLELYPTDDRAMEGRSLATLVIDSVEESSAWASIRGMSRGELPATGRAVLSRVPPNVQAMEKLLVYAPPRATAVIDALRGIPFVELTDSVRASVHVAAAGAGVSVRVAGDRLAPVAVSSTPPSPWSTASLSVEGEDVFPVTSEALCVAMRRAFAAQSLTGVRNPTRNPRLTIAIRVVKTGYLPDTLATATVDTMYEGERYDVLVMARGSATTAPRYLDVALVGHRGIPLVLTPSEPTPYAYVNGGWRPVRSAASVAAPFGADRLVAYFGVFPWSYRELIQSVPPCAQRGRTRDDAGEDPAVAGWTSAERRIVVLPRR